MRRTDVRPISNRRAISDLLAPARYSFRRGQIQSLGQGNEPDAEMFQFLEGRQQIRYGPASAVQSPDQDHIDLVAASCPQQFLTSLSLRRTGANLTDLHSDGPSPPADILPQGVNLQRDGLLVVGGHAGVEAARNIFAGFRDWPKTLSDLAF